MFECFDSLKRAIPCPVVTVPEPVAWEVALIGLALAVWWIWRSRT